MACRRHHDRLETEGDVHGHLLLLLIVSSVIIGDHHLPAFQAQRNEAAAIFFLYGRAGLLHGNTPVGPKNKEQPNGG